MFTHTRVDKSKSVELLVTAISCSFTISNKSTAGADASVEVPKLHNIKLLAFIHTLIIIIMMNFAACNQPNSG